MFQQMIDRGPEAPIPDGPFWVNERTEKLEGKLSSLLGAIPYFERCPFGTGLAGGIAPSEKAGIPAGQNRYYDVILRVPSGPFNVPIPVGIVSKSYQLVQHHTLLQLAIGALGDLGFQMHDAESELIITEYGTRISMRIRFPSRYDIDPGDGHTMVLRIEFNNSVDRSTPLVIRFGWWRLVCSNGLMMMESGREFRKIHNYYLRHADIAEFIVAGLDDIGLGREQLRRWRAQRVHQEQLATWVDGPLQKRWGKALAARTYHICEKGHDGVLLDRFEGGLPHKRSMKDGVLVPGAAVPARNAFAVSQALSWLAGQRRDFEDQSTKLSDIDGLIGTLIHTRAGQQDLPLFDDIGRRA